MNLEVLREIARAGESETVEFKRSIAEKETAARTVCAMLNGPHGGFVIFGISNDGTIGGIDVGTETHDRVWAEIRKIDPPVTPDLESIPISANRSVLVITVPGNTGIFGYEGRHYVRFGASTTIMSESTYRHRLLEHMHAVTRWENRPAHDASFDDLDEQEISVTIEEAVRNGRLADPGNRTTESMLRGLNLISDGQILNAAVVLFGKPGYLDVRYPQCRLRLARFRGTTKDEFVDSRQVVGNAFLLFRQSQRFLVEHLPVASRIPPDSFQRIDTPKYPIEALREAIINALCHRDYAEGGGGVDVAIYDDRLDITSTGGLHFGLTVEQLRTEHQSKPWNPLIAGAFYRRGLIESWGRGTLRIANLMGEAGLPAPEFLETRLSFTVRFRSEKDRRVPDRRGFSQLQISILEILSESGGMTLREIHERLAAQYEREQVRQGLRSLQRTGVVDQSGATNRSTWSLSVNDS